MSLSLVTLKQGETGTFNVPVTDKYGSAVDLSVAEDIRVVVYSNGSEIAIYNLETISGYGSLTLTAPNILNFKLQRSATSIASLGNLIVYVLVKYSGETYNEYSITIGKITKGVLKDEIFWD